MAANPLKADWPDPHEKLLEAARRYRIDMTRCSEEQLRRAVTEAWIEESQEAILARNVWVEKNGLPSDRYRQL